MPHKMFPLSWQTNKIKCVVKSTIAAKICKYPRGFRGWSTFEENAGRNHETFTSFNFVNIKKKEDISAIKYY